MKFVTDLSKGILGKPDSTELWKEIISHIPDEVLIKDNVKILSIASGHCTEADVLVNRMLQLGKTPQEIKDNIYLVDKYKVFTNEARKKGYINVIKTDFLEWEPHMKFDVIVGNPPYNDGTKDGGQNKIYNQFCKKALDISTRDGCLAFITPTSVLKNSKRFSLVGKEGLKYVDFTADKYFDVGIEICGWIIDKQHCGLVTVKDKSENITTQPNTRTVYDYSKIDKEFAKLYTALKLVTNKPNTRMFAQNNFGPAFSKSKVDTHPYKVYKLDNAMLELTYWSKRQPYYYNKNKLSIGMTKALNDSAFYIGAEDFDPGYMTIGINDMSEVDNIKSFIFSDYFKQHSEKWKQLDGYGYNYALKYLPPFDKTKVWTSDEVKEFLESFVSE